MTDLSGKSLRIQKIKLILDMTRNKQILSKNGLVFFCFFFIEH